MPFCKRSYRNSTNIYGDSDVDIVVQLNSVFGKDGTRLDAEQRTAQQQAYTTATYNWADFRRDVLQTLEDYYGKPNVHPLKKCIPGGDRAGKNHGGCHSCSGVPQLRLLLFCNGRVPHDGSEVL